MLIFNLRIIIPILILPILSYGQIRIESISQDSLKIWSSDQLYIYEFYIINDGQDEELNVNVNSLKENTITKIGLGNKLDSSNFKIQLCNKEKALIRVFFKHIPNTTKADDIEIKILNQTDTLQTQFHYDVAPDEKEKKIKLFQNQFTKFLILDLDYNGIKEIVFFDKSRQQYEHIKTRSRILDLSFLEKGDYILEINNEEYIIHKF